MRRAGASTASPLLWRQAGNCATSSSRMADPGPARGSGARLPNPSPLARARSAHALGAAIAERRLPHADHRYVRGVDPGLPQTKACPCRPPASSDLSASPIAVAAISEARWCARIKADRQGGRGDGGARTRPLTGLRRANAPGLDRTGDWPYLTRLELGLGFAQLR